MPDWLKLPLILAAYLGLAPALGFWLAHRRLAQRWTLAAMVFMTSWHINKLTLMVGSIEWYRGHTKGFEGNLIQVLALGLVLASWKEGARGLRWLSGWFWLYLAHCALCTLSLFAAPDKSYVLMAAWKFSSAALMLAAGTSAVRDREDLRWLLRSLTLTLALQAFVVLKLKYIDGDYQVRGWFEHQNPLAMWAYLLGLPLLACGLGPADRLETRWCLAGYAAAAVIIQSALSRAALVMFAIGTLTVALWSLADGFTVKRLRLLFILGCLGALGLLATLDTIVSRFNDEGNKASGETRTVMNLASKAMLTHSALGIGWNNFALTINPPFPYGNVIDDWERDRGHKVDANYAKGVVESHYWLLLAENGYPGFVSYLVFISLSTLAIFRGWWLGRGTHAGVFLLGLAVALLLTYAQSGLERVLTQTKNLSAWLLLLGIALRLPQWNRRKI